jgi:hypothetical protein
VTKHIGNDQNNLAIPKTKPISPEVPRPLPAAAGKEWDSAVVFYQCKAATKSSRGVSLKSKPYFTTGPRDAAQRMTFEKMYRSLTLAEKFLPLELRAY